MLQDAYQKFAKLYFEIITKTIFNDSINRFFKLINQIIGSIKNKVTDLGILLTLCVPYKHFTFTSKQPRSVTTCTLNNFSKDITAGVFYSLLF